MVDALNPTPAVVRDVVLVHGPFTDGSSWSRVIRLLLRAGVTAHAVQTPLSSLADDVAATARCLDRLARPAVLVGHSGAGTVISEIGHRSEVAALVYVAALAPDAGEDPTALAATFPPSPVSAGLVHAAGFARLSEQAFFDHFAEGVRPFYARVLYAVQGPIAARRLVARTRHAAWRSTPCWYAISQRDRVLHPAMQRFVAERMDAAVLELDAGHLSPITHSRAVADLILTAAGIGRELPVHRAGDL